MYLTNVEKIHIDASEIINTFRGSNSSTVSFLNGGQLLTLLHSERPKFYGVLANLCAIGLKEGIHFPTRNSYL